MKTETILIAAAGAVAWHVYTKLTAIETAIKQPQVVHLGIDTEEPVQVKSNPVGFSSPVSHLGGIMGDDFGYGYDPYDGYGYGYTGIGIDIADGDIVEDFGGGFGIDLADGDLEYQIAPGIYVDLE
jgi:hypothetical protein